MAATVFISSCFFEDDTVLPKSDTTKLDIVTDFDELTFLAMQETNFAVEIEQSGNEKDLNFEWAYGELVIETSGELNMREKKVISNDSILSFQFPLLGHYALRLMVDNGDDVKIKVFKLTVSAGYDNGLAVLTVDESNNGNMAFLKTLTDQDIANGVEESVISEFYTDLPINNPQAITSPYNKAICIADGEGKVFVFDQQTMALDMIARPKQLGSGTYITSFSSYYYSPMGERLGAFCITNDKQVYRFDAILGELDQYKTNSRYAEFDMRNLEVDDMVENGYKYTFYVNYTNNTVHGIYGNYGYFGDFSEKYANIWAVGYPYNDSSSKLYFMLTLKDDPSKYAIVRENKDFKERYSTVLDTLDFPAERTITKETKFINSDEYDDYLFYTYNNKIYRWDYKYKGMPKVNDALDFDIPAGEEIVKMCFNGDKDGTKLFIATYNPYRSSEYKGSLYVYDADTFIRINAFEGVIHKAVDMIYKEFKK